MKKDELENLINDNERVVICTHDYPDPDAMGAAFGLQLLIEQIFDKTPVIIGTGVSHPQNRTLVNTLNLPLMTPEEWDKTKRTQGKELVIWVDCNSSSGNTKSLDDAVGNYHPQWTIDHHLDKTSQNVVSGHIESVGASCTLISEYMQEFEFTWQEDKHYKDVATAMILGIMTDTNNLLSPSVTARDLKAFEYLKNYYDQDTYATIMDYDLNPYFYDLIDKAYQSQVKEGSLVVLCLGYLKAERRDAIPFVADLWRRSKEVGTVIAFAIIDNAVTGSVRIKGSKDLKASDLAREVFKSPDSGGHAHMAGGKTMFGPFFEMDLLDDEAKQEFLHAIKKIIVSRARNIAQLDG